MKPHHFAAVLGALGVLVSWACFVPATIELGFVGGWRSAFTGPLFGVGLHLDLVATDLIVLLMAWTDRKTLGPKWLAGIALGVFVLGVCAALPTYCLSFAHPAA